jgi:hypothetical protein
MPPIILKFASNPPLAAPFRYVRPFSRRYPRPAAHNSHLTCRETIPCSPGFTNTVGQALAQLSPGTSDTAALKDYDACRDLLAKRSVGPSRHPSRALSCGPSGGTQGTKSASRRNTKDARLSLAVSCFARFPGEDPESVKDVPTCGRARLPSSLHVRDNEISTFSTSREQQATIPQ